ncbi:MAG: hypothetical protein N2651_04265 [Fimbriimonadales bacterium]|nr:hypothetical protein [Fimbriimonadales bacterium]
MNRPKPQLHPETPLLAAHALEWIAWHTGYPIIGDATRFVSAPYPQSLDNPRTLLAQCRHTATATPALRQAIARWEAENG